MIIIIFFKHYFMPYVKYNIKENFFKTKNFDNLLNMRILLLFFITFISFKFIANEESPVVEIGQTWLLNSKSNKASISSSKVLYFFSSDVKR